MDINKLKQQHRRWMYDYYRTIRLNFFISAALLLLAGNTYASVMVPDTVVGIRFIRPVYDCLNRSYCIDVGLQSWQPNQQLYGMNVRFMFDSSVMEYVSMTTVPGYNVISEGRVTMSPATGPDFGFSGLPGGERFLFNFYSKGSFGYWWSLTEDYTNTSVWHRRLEYGSTTIFRVSFDKASGFSVRCIKN